MLIEVSSDLAIGTDDGPKSYERSILLTYPGTRAALMFVLAHTLARAVAEYTNTSSQMRWFSGAL
jgi:hypothetical protein